MKVSETVRRDLQRYMISHSIKRVLDAQDRLAILRSDPDYSHRKSEREWEVAKAEVNLSHHLRELGELLPGYSFTIRRKA